MAATKITIPADCHRITVMGSTGQVKASTSYLQKGGQEYIDYSRKRGEHHDVEAVEYNSEMKEFIIHLNHP